MHRHERSFRALARLMNHLSEELLARAGLAKQEDGGIRRSDRTHLFDRTLEGGGGADDFAQRKLAVEAGLERDDFFLRGAGLQPAIKNELHLTQVYGLLEEPIGPETHRLHRGVHVAVGRHHNADGLVGQLERAVDDRHTVFARHAEIREHRIGRDVLHKARRFRGVLGHESLIAIFQCRAQSFADILLVVDDEHRGFHGLRLRKRSDGSPHPRRGRLSPPKRCARGRPQPDGP